MMVVMAGAMVAAGAGPVAQTKPTAANNSVATIAVQTPLSVYVTAAGSPESGTSYTS